MKPGNHYTAIFKFRRNKDKSILRKMAKDPLIENRIAQRARILLLRSEGKTQTLTAIILKIALKTVWTWEHRYLESGLDGLYDKPGRGRKPSFSP